MSIVVTGATGHLGRHVVEQLLEKVPADQITAVVRTPEKAADFAERGVRITVADYNFPETFGLFSAGDKVLLISGNEVDRDRVAQHKVVLGAAKAADVALLAYTSAPGTLTAALADDHRATEEAVLASGLPYVLLRNGWYHENYTEQLAPVLEHGAVVHAAAGPAHLRRSRRLRGGRRRGADRQRAREQDVRAERRRGMGIRRVRGRGGPALGQEIVYTPVSVEAYTGILTGPGCRNPSPRSSREWTCPSRRASWPSSPATFRG